MNAPGGFEGNKTGFAVSVVVCAHTLERWNELNDAVCSLQNQTMTPAEIILVIDHNSDLFRRACDEFIQHLVLENVEAPGLAGSRNTAVAVAQGDIVAFLDDDAVADPDWLEHLLKAYADPDVIGVGGEIIPDWPHTSPEWFPGEFYWVIGCTYLGMADRASPVRNIIGANMSFRREVFNELRFFNGLGYSNGRSLGGEETDLCIRLHTRWPDKTVMYQPNARIRHRVSAHRIGWRYFRDRCYSEGLAKAILSRRVGSTSGLASERSYTLKTLPKGVIRGLTDTAIRFDIAGALRSAAIVFGFTVTVAGFIVGTTAQHIPRLRERAGFEPKLQPDTSS